MTGRRYFGLLAVLTMGAIGLTACAGNQPAQVKVADTVTLSLDQEPDTLFAGIGSMMARTEVLGAARTRLVLENDKSEYIAVGAESKPTIENGGAKFVGTGVDRHLEVTFRIKPQKWQDGQPLTAEDLRFGWLTRMNPDFPAESRTNDTKLWDLAAPDPKTVVAKFMSEAQAVQAAAGNHPVLKDASAFSDYKGWAGKGPVVDPLYYTFGDGGGDYILPKHILGSIPPKQMEKSDFARKPIYNGAYKVKEWTAGQQIVLEANPDYFQGAPKIKNMVFKIVKDSSVLIAGLKANEIDVVLQIGLDLDNKPELDPLADKFDIYLNPGTKWEHIDFNLTDPMLADVHVRRAIGYAINRKQIVDTLLFGKTEVADSFLPSFHPYAKANSDKIVKYPYDKAKAEQELKDGGWVKGADGVYAKAGKRLKVKLQTTTATLRQQTAQLIQKDLKAVGFDADTEFLVARNFFAGAGKGPLSNGNFQLGMYTWLQSSVPVVDGLYSGKNIPTKDNGWVGQNYPRYSGANDLIQQADVIGDNVVNETKRISLYGDILKQWTSDLPVLPLFLRVSPQVARKGMKNFRPTVTSAPETWNAWEWELPPKS